MNGRRAKIEITEANYEKMSFLAEDVMQQLYMHYYAYDEEGNDIFEKYYNRDGDWEVNKEFMHNEDFVAAPTVPDDYLTEAFAREVRNMMMIFAGQRLHDEQEPKSDDE